MRRPAGSIPLRLLLLLVPGMPLLLLVLLSPGRATAAPRSQDEPRAAPRSLMIVCAPGRARSARPWVKQRQVDGWKVTTEVIAATETAADVKARIRMRYKVHRIMGGAEFAVLLMGDAGPGGVPTWSFPQTDPSMIGDDRHRTYVSDHPYQLMEGDDEVPDIALGRVPARTDREALLYYAKIRRYEKLTPPGPWRRRVNYTAGEGRFGAIDAVLEQVFKNMVERLVPDAYDLSMTYAKPSSIYCPPPGELTATILHRLGEGSLLFNYVGHGWEGGFDQLHYAGRRQPMLDRADLDALEMDDARFPIALLTCCSAGWYDLEDGERSIGEALLLHPNGPVAVIAGSRITHPYANTILQMDVTRLLLVDRVATVGELDRLACRSMLKIDALDREIDRLARPIATAGGWASSLADLRRMHVRLYNLLGDPSMRIAHPAERIADLEIADGRVRGTAPRITSGTALVTFESPQVALAHPGRIRPVIDDTDPEFPAKAAVNYPLANDRVFASLETEVVNGVFAAEIPAGLPAAAVVVKVYVSGTDGSGVPIDAFGATRRLP